MAHWLLKSDPDTYSWADLERDGKTFWDGVRNYQARNHMRAMKKSDLALLYHSQEEKAVVGIAEVMGNAYPDPTDRKKEGWLAVDIRPKAKLKKPVTLAAMKARKDLAGMALFRQSRLSVMPLTQAEFEAVVRMGG
jgi:predicted RNA-binding protein with PUA-like domain